MEQNKFKNDISDVLLVEYLRKNRSQLCGRIGRFVRYDVPNAFFLMEYSDPRIDPTFKTLINLKKEKYSRFNESSLQDEFNEIDFFMRTMLNKNKSAIEKLSRETHLLGSFYIRRLKRNVKLCNDILQEVYPVIKENYSILDCKLSIDDCFWLYSLFNQECPIILNKYTFVNLLKSPSYKSLILKTRYIRGKRYSFHLLHRNCNRRIFKW